MKKQFLSNGTSSVPRVWQLLMTMVFLFTLGVTQMWGAASSVIPSSPNYKDISAAVANHVYTFECLASSITEEADATSSWIGWYSTQSSFKIYDKSGSANCMGSQKKIANLKYDKVYFYVTKCDSFQIQAWANGSDRTLNYSYQPVGGSVTEGSFTESSNTDCAHSDFIPLDKTKNYTICVWNGNGEEIAVTYMVFKTATPTCTAPTGLTVGGGGEYTAGTDMGFEASATDNVDDATLYTWYKGNTWDAAKVTTPVQAAKTNAQSGRYFHIDPCALGDAGTYWCSAANGTCEAHASVTVTVVPAGGTKYDITYNNTKGATNPNPAQYTKGVGVASFAALPDVDGFHFTSWNPTSISESAEGHKTVIANWVPTYNVSFDKGAGSGTAPAGFQKWEGAKFNLPGQGDMVAPSGKVFDGWKVGVSEKYAAGAEYTMGTTGVEFVAQWKAVAQTIFHWQGNSGSLTIDAANGTTTGGTTILRTTDKAWAQESASYHSSVADDMKCLTSGKELKPGGNANYLELKLTSGTFQEGDTIFVTGYNEWAFCTSATNIASATSFDVASFATGTSKDNNGVKTGYGIIADGIDAATIYARRKNGSSSGIAAIKVVRPAARPIASTVISLTDVKVNGTSISADELGALLSAKSLALDGEFAVAPEIKFNQHTKITYADGKEPETKESDKVYTVTATTVAGNWQAQQEINAITYTVTATKVTSAKVYYYDGSNKLGEEVVALYGNPAEYATYQAKVQLASFVDWYTNSDLAEEHKIADISAMQVTGDINVYGKWTPAYATSVNIEKLVMQNGKGYGIMPQMGAQHYASNITGDLDSLSVKSDSLRNYSYLGLKVKKSGGLLNFRLAKDNTVKIKFGFVDTTKPQISINGGDYAAITIPENHIYTYTAEADALVSIKTMDTKAVVFQQIMIGEEIQSPELYPISYADAENGSIAGLKMGIPGETIKVYPTADAGYVPSTVTVNGTAIDPVENVYSFVMPNEAVTIAATFAVPSFAVTYNANNGSSDKYVDTDAATILDNTFTYADHIFLGWNTEANGSGVAYAVGATVTGNLNLYAQWLEFTGCFYFGAKSVAANEDITAPATLSTTIVGGSVEATYGTFSYTPYGVLISGGGDRYFTVNLDKAVTTGSKITIVMAAGSTGGRGLNICYEADKNKKAYDGMYWDAAAAGEEKTFEYTLDANSAIKDKKVFYLYRNNNVYLKSIAVEYCAPEDYTVTYMDGASTLGTEMVYEGNHPTADGINTHKKGYEFQGWAETVDGAVVDLNDITITAAKNLYAQYTVKDCSTMGVKFTMVPNANTLSSDYQLTGTTEQSIGEYATVTGGVVYLNNNNSSNRVKITKTTSAIQLVSGDDGYIHVELDCPLKENDSIKFANSERLVLAHNASKTSSVNIAKTDHFYIVPASWEGKYDFYIWRTGTGCTISGIEVVRPEIYAVSFNLMGHGSAIAPVDVVKGGKITAPSPAPVDADYAFAGWYKENTLSNAWDFANDVVEAATTLYAKWIDMSDATLVSLKYGATDIALVDGTYEYNVELPALTTAVPALSAETSNPNANAEVTNATEFDAEGHATSIVTVTPEKVGAAPQVYTVNFSKAAAVDQVNVTGSTTWNFSAGGSTSLTNQTDVVLANVPGIINNASFNSQALKGTFNKMEGTYFQGNMLTFTTEVPGKLTVVFRGTNNNARHMKVLVGDGETELADWNYQGSGDGAQQTKTIVVPAGKVTLRAFEGTTPNNARIYRMELNATPDYHRTVNSSILGTLCWTNNAVLVDATLYELAGKNENNYLVFDEVEGDSIKAGKPYIFMPENGKTEIKVFNTDNEAALTEDQDPVNNMYGTLVGKTLVPGQDDNMYYFSNSHIWAVKDFAVSISVPAYYCYVDYVAILNGNPAPAQAPGRRRVTMGVKGEQVATGFENLNASEKPVKLMINGQMFILRGEKLFDATGRLVK